MIKHLYDFRSDPRSPIRPAPPGYRTGITASLTPLPALHSLHSGDCSVTSALYPSPFHPAPPHSWGTETVLC